MTLFILLDFFPKSQNRNFNLNFDSVRFTEFFLKVKTKAVDLPL